MVAALSVANPLRVNPPLPNYFLADLPAEAELTPSLITAACHTLKRNRLEHLAKRSTEEILRFLDELGAHWRDPNYRFRREAIASGESGFSKETLEAGLDDFLRELTHSQLKEFLAGELGDDRRLDSFSPAPAPRGRARALFARGPELIAHICPGNLPIPALMNIVCGLLVRSGQFVKCATGASLIPRLFAHSIHELDPKLASCLEIASWRGGSVAIEDALFAEADCVTATGSDESIGAIRHRLPSNRRFLTHGSKVSVGFVTAQALGQGGATALADKAAHDVAVWDQRGCLSPHVIYVETGGAVSPEGFAELLSVGLTKLEASHPRSSLPTQEAAAIADRRAVYRLRAAHSPETRIWTSKETTAWTVIWEADPSFQVSCQNRFIYVKPVKDLDELRAVLEPIRERIACVGLAARSTAQMIALELAHWGVPRICPLGAMQQPQLAWPRDGRPALADLVTWSEWEA